MSLPGTLTLGELFDGRYRVERPIGSGGMADVYLATDETLGRQVALKVLARRYAGDADFVERFRREATAAAGLGHPNIVSIYDRGEAEGTFYIAMEYLDGEDLKALIRRDGPLPARMAVRIASGILEALAFSHRRGIVHRDIKPQNVIVMRDGRVKVVDFGIARAGDSTQMTEAGSILGTAAYIAPEQAAGRPATAASDLYSTGVVLYEMLAGRPPFTGDSAITVALRHMNDDPPPLRDLVGGVPPALQAVVLRALQKDPRHRYADAEVFLDDLAATQDGGGLDPETQTSLLGATGMPTGVLPRSGRTPAMVPVEAPVMVPRARAAYVAEPVYDEPPRRRRGPLLAALLVLLLAVAAVAAGVYLIGGTGGGGAGTTTDAGPGQVAVPGVVGRTQTDAAQILRAQGFMVDPQSQESDQKPEIVLSQDPPAGRQADAMSAVRIVVSSGPGSVDVPDVAGQSPAEARAALTQAGFVVASTPRTENDDTVAKGKVVDTSPPGGGSAQKGATVTLIVSDGPATVDVPNLVGMTVDSASSALEGVGLALGRQGSGASDAVQTGQVFNQSPSPGGQAVPGSAVDVTVSSGPSAVAVPDVRGLTQDAATAAIETAGFVSRVTTRPRTNPAEVGRVYRQGPQPGAMAPAGSTVEIVVGTSATPTAPVPAPVPPPSTTTTTTTTTSGTTTEGIAP